MSLLFNMLSRSVIAFLPRSKCLLLSWLQSPSEVILETKKIISITVVTLSPSICHEVMGQDAMTLVDQVVSLLFNMLSRSVITFLPMSKLLHFMAVVTVCSDLGAQENKLHRSVTAPTFSLSIYHEVMGPSVSWANTFSLGHRSHF